MSTLAVIKRWKWNGLYLPRNPDSFEFKPDKVNANYVVMADGSQRRVGVPVKIPAGDITITWKAADRAMKTAMAKLLTSDGPQIISRGDVQPAMDLYCYIDQPQWTMSDDLDLRTGQGGQRDDLQLVGRSMSAYFNSTFAIPVGSPTTDDILDLYGGPTKTVADGLPSWNSQPWKQVLSATGYQFSNLGTAPWGGVIRLGGPFASGLQIVAAYKDVDGTGGGVSFTYTGADLADGDYLMFDTSVMRLYSVVSSARNESYAFIVQTVANQIPFAYWPAFPPGNFNLTVSGVSGNSGSSYIDLTNGATETFRYWG